MSAPAGAAGIEIRGLRKRYGNTLALDGLDLDLRPGEVLGVAGPNGAGKSTLVRILAGEERADAGELTLDGRPGRRSSGWTEVAVVHQEPQLFPNLTVAENLLVGREGRRPCCGRRSGADDQRLMEALGLGRLAAVPLEDCTLATQQRTEIARALARNARVFLFDEPNSALTDEESDELFREMHELAAAGRIVILVTHRLGELVEHAGRVVVIRDGRIAACARGRRADRGRHRPAARARRRQGAGRDAVARSAAGRTRRPRVDRRLDASGRRLREVALAVPAGEIVALMGVEGSGARELLRSLSRPRALRGPDRDRRRSAARRPCWPLGLRARDAPGEPLHQSLGRREPAGRGSGAPEIAGFGLRLRVRRMRALAEDAGAPLHGQEPAP